MKLTTVVSNAVLIVLFATVLHRPFEPAPLIRTVPELFEGWAIRTVLGLFES